MGGVFISYRRDDTAPYAGRLRDGLTAVFGKDQVFRDVDRVAPGERFPAVIERAIGSCDAVITLIGPRWLSAQDDTRGRRLEDPRDYVRQEVAAALRREDVLVIPVLVEGAEMPEPDALPEDLAPLAERNALVMSDIRWEDDMAHLVGALRRVVQPAGKKKGALKPSRGERERARPVAPPPPPTPTPPPAPRPPADERPEREQARRFPVGAAVAVAVVCVALVAVVALVLGGGGGDGGDDGGGTAEPTTVPARSEGPRYLTVSAQQLWTDSGIDVVAGDRLEVQASGNILYSPADQIGPEGLARENLRPHNVIPEYNHAGLIGRIGEFGAPFPVGSALSLTAPAGGRLFLGVNDLGVDNNGPSAFQVTVTVTAA